MLANESLGDVANTSDSIKTIRRQGLAANEHENCQKYRVDSHRIAPSHTLRIHGLCFNLKHCAIITSIWRSSLTICFGVNLSFGVTKLLSKPTSLESLGSKKPGQVNRVRRRD